MRIQHRTDITNLANLSPQKMLKHICWMKISKIGNLCQQKLLATNKLKKNYC